MKYIDSEKLIAEIKRLKNLSQEAKMEYIKDGYTQNALAEDYRLRSIKKLLSFIASLQQEAEEERIRANKEAQETSIMYRDTVIRHIERKRILPTFKGKLLHKFKNELNTMAQILNIKNWPAVQYAIFEKVALVFAAWGGYHFHPKEIESEDSQRQEQPEVELEKEIEKHIESFGWGKTKHLAEKELINCTARHFYELGKNSK